MIRTPPVHDRDGIACRRSVFSSAPAGIAIVVAIACAFAGRLSADPLHAPPTAGEEHGQFFDSLELLDPATLALPPLPARVPATPLKPANGSTPELPTGPVADSWMWQLTADSLPLPQQGPPTVREKPPASGWARIVAKATPILLAAGAMLALAVLISLTQRR